MNASAMNIFKWGGLAVLMIAVCTVGQTQDALAASEDWVKLYEPQPNDAIPYRLMKPIDFNASKQYPVIVSLHGGGGTGIGRQWSLNLRRGAESLGPGKDMLLE